MKHQPLREPLPEDRLPEDVREVRISQFKELDAELRVTRTSKMAGHQAKASAKHLRPHIKRRLALLGFEQRYVNLSRRIECFRGLAARNLNSSNVWKKLLGKLAEMLAKDAKHVIESTNNRRTRKLIEKITAEAVTMDRLLTEYGVSKDSELRPSSCLPGGHSGLSQNPNSRVLLNPSALPALITFEGKLYHRNNSAKMAFECSRATELQCTCAALHYGYEMKVTVIARYMGFKAHKTVEDHIDSHKKNCSPEKRGKHGRNKWEPTELDDDQ